ncbi:MAG: hypothetical protein C4334_06540 [Pyrinomonas sp.]|uniref:flagellar export protein FliJ n=1 Tax=Pyrinomonas sp. TaxID=2080306 RepID=UPI0033194A35
MKKNRYHLQRLMELRERAKKQQAELVAAKRAQLAAAEQELNKRQLAVEECRVRQREAKERMFRSAETGLEAAKLVQHRVHLADLKRQEEELIAAVEQQRAVVRRCQDELDKALVALAEATKEHRVIEKHKEKWQEAQRRAEEKKAQKASDEMAGIMHERRSWDE